MANISIIIPLYNKQRYITKTIQSVLNQSYADFEIIVVNDGSTDNSVNVVHAIKDDRIHLIDKENEGVSATRNRGAEEAHTDLLFFLDADDTIYPTCIETLLKLRDDYPNASVWTANYIKVKDKSETKALGDLPRGYVVNIDKLRWERKWHFRMGSFICTRNSFLNHGGFDPKVSIYEDYLLIDKYTESDIIAYTPHIVMSYIIDNKGLSISNVPLSKRAEGNLVFEGKRGYRRLKCGEKLGVYLVSCLTNGNWKDLLKLIKKYKVNTFYCLYALIRRVIR